VIVDIYYDHFLSRYWNDYSDEDLRAFVASAYELLIRKYRMLPSRSKYLLPFMISQNWLVGYGHFYSLERVFKGMARRARFESGMEHAVDDLKKNYPEYEQEFRQFFPEIILHIKDFKEKSILL
jgi:acyl carrier protein phosphodiesterase